MVLPLTPRLRFLPDSTWHQLNKCAKQPKQSEILFKSFVQKQKPFSLNFPLHPKVFLLENQVKLLFHFCFFPILFWKLRKASKTFFSTKEFLNSFFICSRGSKVEPKLDKWFSKFNMNLFGCRLHNYLYLTSELQTPIYNET